MYGHIQKEESLLFILKIKVKQLNGVKQQIHELVKLQQQVKQKKGDFKDR